MAGRRITMRVGPLTKGLTDFPEHTGPDWCTQALNVEFVNGGVTTRRGMQRIVSDFYASAATVKLVKAFPLVERNSPVAPMGGEIVVVGIVPTAGGDAKSERVLIRHLSNGSLDGRMRDTELIAPTDDTNPSPRSRWDACVMREPHRSQMTVIVCTDHVSQKTTTVFRSNEFLFTMNPLVPINRVAQPFHGGREVAIGEEDDEGDYTVLPLRARYCRVIAERLVLGDSISLMVLERLLATPSGLVILATVEVGHWITWSGQQVATSGPLQVLQNIAERFWSFGPIQSLASVLNRGYTLLAIFAKSSQDAAA